MWMLLLSNQACVFIPGIVLLLEFMELWGSFDGNDSYACARSALGSLY